MKNNNIHATQDWVKDYSHKKFEKLSISEGGTNASTAKDACINIGALDVNGDNSMKSALKFNIADNAQSSISQLNGDLHIVNNLDKDISKDAYIRLLLTKDGKIKYARNTIDGEYTSGELYSPLNKPTPYDIGAISKTISIDGKDILGIVDDGWYYGVNMTNVPPPTTNNAGYIRVMTKIGEHLHYRVVCWRPHNSQTEYVNVLNNGTWLGWTETFTNKGGTLTGSLTIKDGYLTIPSNNKNDTADYFAIVKHRVINGVDNKLTLGVGASGTTSLELYQDNAKKARVDIHPDDIKFTKFTNQDSVVTSLLNNGSGKIKVGSYEGGGGYGSYSPNIISGLGFKPQAMLISYPIHLDTGDYSDAYGTIFITRDMSHFKIPVYRSENHTLSSDSMGFYHLNISGLLSVSSAAHITWNDDNISWYADNTVSQLNVGALKYPYVIFG